MTLTIFRRARQWRNLQVCGENDGLAFLNSRRGLAQIQGSDRWRPLFGALVKGGCQAPASARHCCPARHGEGARPTGTAL